MPLLQEQNSEDDEEKLAAFRQFSRQVLLMALFEDDNLASEDDEANPATTAPFAAFSRYLLAQQPAEFGSPEELSAAAWANMASQLTGAASMPDLPALAKTIYQLLKQELLIQNERQIRRKPW